MSDFIQLGTAKTEVLPAGYESFVLDMPMMGTVPGMFIPDFSGRIVAAEAMLEANLKHFIRFEKL
ncbi:MAG: hypothetical protein IIY11_04665 [Clostridia bacterium]|nr:hypothetical protein [Clostridia bacterium]